MSPDNGFLCGENFRSRLTKDVEEDSSLAKALSVTMRNQKPVDSSSSRNGEQPSGRFFDRAPPHCTGLGRAELRSRTIHILPTGKQANTTEVCSPQTSADPARAPSTTNRKSPPRSGKPNRRSFKTVTNTPRAQPKPTRTFTDGYAYLTCPRPIGGCLAFFMANWEEVSNDPWVLEAVRSYKIEFISGPRQREPPGQIAMNAEQSQAMTLEIQELHKKGAVVQADSHSGGVVSQVFLVPKSDGAWRPVLNLKSLNQFVVPHHFKMESIRTLEGVLQKDDWLLKLDLKDAYLSIPIHQNYQHFLNLDMAKRFWTNF